MFFFTPVDFDYTTSQLVEGFHLLSRDGYEVFWCTDKSVHHGAMVEDLKCCSEEEALEVCERADMIVMPVAGDMGHTKGVRAEVIQRYGDRVAFVDGHDSDAFLVDPKLVKVYFKREVRRPIVCQWPYPNVRSLTFGVYQFCLDWLVEACGSYEDDFDRRDIDVAFMAFGGSHPLRQQCCDILNAINGNGLKTYAKVASDRQPVEMEEYREVLRRSKIGISLPGAGFDTQRFWETMGHGAVLCSFDFLSNLIVRNFPEPNRHALYFDSWFRMVELCRLVVSDKGRWVQMRRATDELLVCHSTKHRAQEVKDIFLEMC